MPVTSTCWMWACRACMCEVTTEKKSEEYSQSTTQLPKDVSTSSHSTYSPTTAVSASITGEVCADYGGASGEYSPSTTVSHLQPPWPLRTGSLATPSPSPPWAPPSYPPTPACSPSWTRFRQEEERVLAPPGYSVVKGVCQPQSSTRVLLPGQPICSLVGGQNYDL